MKGILGYTTKRWSHRTLFTFTINITDIKASIMLNESYMKIVAWYDNEWGIVIG